MRHDGDFAAYMAARWPAIVRSLVLLGCAQERADGIARQALARCYLAWGRVREADDIDVQVYRTVLEDLARSGQDAAGQQPVHADVRSTAADATDAVRVRNALEAALTRLPADDRSVVVLRFAAGLSELQVAAVLELPEGEVESRLASAVTGLDLPRVWEASR
jgi:DNA-directed RNA polymerase specialized sigma24 family protein